MSERAQALEAALRETAHALRRLNDLDPTQHAMVCSTLHHIDQALAAPPVGVSPQPDTRRDCTCLGTCRGAEGLGPRWKCALESPASLAPVGPTPELTPDAQVCAWREIETAPKELNVEMLCVWIYPATVNLSRGIVRRVAWRGPHDTWWTSTGQATTPTLWMPIPPVVGTAPQGGEQ